MNTELFHDLHSDKFKKSLPFIQTQVVILKVLLKWSVLQVQDIFGYKDDVRISAVFSILLLF